MSVSCVSLHSSYNEVHSSRFRSPLIGVANHETNPVRFFGHNMKVWF